MLIESAIVLADVAISLKCLVKTPTGYSLISGIYSRNHVTLAQKQDGSA